jgi:hypothetical protein
MPPSTSELTPSSGHSGPLPVNGNCSAGESSSAVGEPAGVTGTSIPDPVDGGAMFVDGGATVEPCEIAEVVDVTGPPVVVTVVSIVVGVVVTGGAVVTGPPVVVTVVSIVVGVVVTGGAVVTGPPVVVGGAAVVGGVVVAVVGGVMHGPIRATDVEPEPV